MENKSIELASYYSDMFSVVSEYYSINEQKVKVHYYKKYDLLIDWSEVPIYSLNIPEDCYLFIDSLSDNLVCSVIPIWSKSELIGYQLFVCKLDAEEYYMRPQVLRDKIKKVSQMFFYSLFQVHPKDKHFSNNQLKLKFSRLITFERVNQENYIDSDSLNQHELDYLEFSIFQSFRLSNYSMGEKSVKEYIKLSSSFSLKKQQTHLTSLIVLLTKIAIELGTSTRIAYGIRDSYIEKFEFIQRTEDILMYASKSYLRFFEKVELITLSANHYLVSESIKYIESHLYSPFQIKHIADFLHCSPNYLSTLFKEITKVNLSFFIRERKIEEAKYLIKYEYLNLSEVGEMLGFSNQSHFTREFKKMTGDTPKDFRNKNSVWTM